MIAAICPQLQEGRLHL